MSEHVYDVSRSLVVEVAIPARETTLGGSKAPKSPKIPKDTKKIPKGRNKYLMANKNRQQAYCIKNIKSRQK